MRGNIKRERAQRYDGRLGMRRRILQCPPRQMLPDPTVKRALDPDRRGGGWCVHPPGTRLASPKPSNDRAGRRPQAGLFLFFFLRSSLIYLFIYLATTTVPVGTIRVEPFRADWGKLMLRTRD